MLIRRFDSRAFQALEKKKKPSKLQTGVPDGDSRRGFQTGSPKVDVNSSTHDHTNPQI